MKKIVLFVFVLTFLLSGVAGMFVSVDIVGVSRALEVAPDFALTDIDGNMFSLNDFRGRVVLLEFFATWCIPCVNETSHLKILCEGLGEKLVIISISSENGTVLRKHRESHSIIWTIARDTVNVFDTCNVSGIPTLVIIDQQRYICCTHVGLTEEIVLRSEIESLFLKTIYVDDDNVVGPWNGTLEHPYRNITSGLEHASANDTIFVRSGTYHEHLDVNKPLTLIGENRESTIVDGNRTGTVIKVTANNVAVSQFTVRNGDQSAGTAYAGIKISGRGCNITGNYVTKNKIGIFVTSKKSRITENIVTNNGHGIALYDSSEVTVEANNVSANTVGISLAFSSRNTIIGNRAANSSVGGHGITLLSNSFNNTILSNDLVNNYHGMWLSSSFGNWVFNNTIANNELLGIELASSPDNTFYHNNFVNNPKHIVIDNKSISIWDDSYPSGGNYWSDYVDVDDNGGPYQNVTGSDGIWDHPYLIDADNRDNYPLAEPWFLGDKTPPTITEVSQSPPKENVPPEDEVKVNATVTDMLTGVKQVILNYTTDNVTWFHVIMTKLERNIYNATIQQLPYGTNVTYAIIAEDNEGNTVTTKEMGHEYYYHVIPEFPSFLILPLFMMATVLAVVVCKRNSVTSRLEALENIS